MPLQPRDSCRADKDVFVLNIAYQQFSRRTKMNPQCSSGRHPSSVKLALAVVVLPVLLLTGSSRSQDIYAYPAKGQSQAQQDRDRYECHSWAVKQTGFDPSRAQASASEPSPSNQPPPPQGQIVRAAGRGAALGAVGGAITRDAGKGAAAGAAMGGLAADFVDGTRGFSKSASNKPILNQRRRLSRTSARPTIARSRRVSQDAATQ
jgi:hypothetical protein